MEEQEKYLGEVRSGYLARGVASGYAIYVTTKRIIGVKKRRDGFLDTPDLVGLIYDHEIEKHEMELASKLEKDVNGEGMKMLLESNDLEIKKEEIKRIQLKKSEGWRTGHLKILLRTGKEIGIRMLVGTPKYTKVFEKLGELMQAFYPEVLELED